MEEGGWLRGKEDCGHFSLFLVVYIVFGFNCSSFSPGSFHVYTDLPALNFTRSEVQFNCEGWGSILFHVAVNFRCL